ncbi:hypothetical protein PSm6_01300 [Pseudomonas solani]|uniref:Uncharacterized protein n=1 Tax=Pseudomonas solani TaxID=2731552 RepID=A0ABM7L2G1_9PSED|nr:hypothetical protein PSm6_01300 [Pseudomonas solani]
MHKARERGKDIKENLFVECAAVYPRHTPPPRLLLLLVADPKHRRGDHDQDEAENRDGIDAAVRAGVFGVIVHGIPLLWLWVLRPRVKTRTGNLSSRRDGPLPRPVTPCNGKT